MDPISNAPIQPLYSPAHTDRAFLHQGLLDYIRLKSQIDVLHFVLAASEGYQGMPSPHQTFATWLEEHRENGYFSGSPSQAANLLSDKKAKNTEMLRVISEQIDNLMGEIEGLEHELSQTTNRGKRKILEEMIQKDQADVNSLKSVVTKMKELQALLNQLKIVPINNDKFEIKGPMNWENLLNQLDK